MQPPLLLLCYAVFSVAATLLYSYPAHSATVTIINRDRAREGLNDRRAADPASKAGGNSGSTLGTQRRIALQRAADIWGALLSIPVEIKVGANFDPMECDETSTLLGTAGPNTVHGNFVEAPLQNTWYTQALANSFAAMDLAPDQDDMGVTFNSAIGTSCAFPNVWYYGLDGNPPSDTIDFVTVALHELAHGLGFLSLVDVDSGEKLLGFDDVFMRNLEDHSTGKLYPQMSDAERVNAAKNTGNLHWIGAEVVAASGTLTNGVHLTGHVEMYAPNPQEPGSSGSHFSTDLAPDEIMEPFYTGANHDVGLILPLLQDLGWRDPPPGAVADLAVDASNLTSIDLSWTAPGDGGNGAAASYDIRYAASKITNDKWSSATPVNGVPAPAAPGLPQNLTVSRLSCGRTYYFALKTFDGMGSVSVISNVAVGETQTCPTLTVAPLALPDGEANVLYDEEFEITGGFPPYTIQIVGGSLPQGLALGSPVITGIPVQAHKVKVTILVTDQVGASTRKVLKLRILRAVTIATNTLKAGRLNRSYNLLLKAKGGKPPYNWNLTGALPAGLTFDPVTGRINGVPTEPGAFELEFDVTDFLSGTASKIFTLSVQ
ncbi:MAG: putative Ig domain-containing protein [Candidatus Binatia bacterium]